MAEVITNNNELGKASEVRHLSAWSILRKSSKISGANVLGVLVLFPVNILLARVLGPELWGVVGYVALWQLYASFSRPGMFGAAYREIPHLMAQGQSDEAIRTQNIGVTGDGLYLMLPMAVMVVVGLWQPNILLRNGLIAGAFVFGITQARDMLTNLQWARQRFGLVAKMNLLVTVVTAVFMLATVKWLGYLTPILSPGVAAVSVIVALLLGSPSLGLKFQLDRKETFRLLKIGLPMGLSTLFYWGFRMADRTAVAVWLSLADLGHLTFALQFINLAILLVSDFSNVVQPALWTELGRTSQLQSLGPQIRRLSLVMLLVTCIGANLAQAGFGALVYWVVPEFSLSVPVFEIIVFLLAVGTMGFVPTHLLNSARLNKQSLVMIVWGLSLPINMGLAYFMVKMGRGLTGIAVSSVLSQGLASVALLVVAQKRLSHAGDRHWLFYAAVAAMLLTALVVFIIFQIGPFSYGTGSNIPAALALRLVLFGTVWGIIGSFILLAKRKGLGLAPDLKTNLVVTGSACAEP